METIIDRPYADYAKDIGRLCELWSQGEGVPTTVFYTGYLDGFNNHWVQRWFEHPLVERIVTVVANDYMTNSCSHRLNIEQLAKIDRTFVIISEVKNPELDFDHYPNIHWLHMGPSLVAEHRLYSQVRPQRTKNLLSGPHWMSLNRTTRPHRMLLASVLAEQGLGVDQDPNGLLKLDSHNHGTYETITNYSEWRNLLGLYLQRVPGFDQLAPIQIDPALDARIQTGWNMLAQDRHTPQIPDEFVKDLGRKLNNHENFDQHLRKYYQTAVVEFVPETLYFGQGRLVSEKFTNSVMGFCFPIMVAVPGTVQYLRDLGFDMFDDVIDHSYDLVQDSVQRAFAVVERNRRLLQDPEHARQCWLKCYTRFEANYQRIVQGIFHQQMKDQLRYDYCGLLKKLK